MSLESFSSSIEAPEPAEQIPGLKEIEERVLSSHERMERDESRVSTLLAGVVPENKEQEVRLASLQERAAELTATREDLTRAGNATMLDILLRNIQTAQQEGTDSQGIEQIRQVFTNNPELARTVLGGLLLATEEERVRLDAGRMQDLSEKVKEVAEEIEVSDKKIIKGLTLRTAERLARAIISASTLGIGGVVYDTAKDIVVSMQARKELRTRRAMLLNSSAALVR